LLGTKIYRGWKMTGCVWVSRFWVFGVYGYVCVVRLCANSTHTTPTVLYACARKRETCVLCARARECVVCARARVVVCYCVCVVCVLRAREREWTRCARARVVMCYCVLLVCCVRARARESVDPRKRESALSRASPLSRESVGLFCRSLYTCLF